MRRIWLSLALAACVFAAAAEKPRVKRASLAAMERAADARLLRLLDDPYQLVGATRGYYVDGYGAVFSAELNLVNAPSLSPFRPTISKEEIARVRAKKLERLPALRQSLRDILVSAAASLDEVPVQDRIVLGVTLLALPYEDTTGVPQQIVLQAERSKLLEAKLRGAAADIAVREF